MITILIACFIKRHWFIRGWLILMLVHFALAALLGSNHPDGWGFVATCNLIGTTLLYGFVGLIRWLGFWRPADAAKKAGVVRN
jgi:hypothetical protein